LNSNKIKGSAESRKQFIQSKIFEREKDKKKNLILNMNF